MGEQVRLTPQMSSRKLQALDFIKRYFAQWGQSPTLNELAAALDVSTKRAHDLVHALATQQMIEHVSGQPRGIRLVDRGEELSEADVLVRLARMGWTIGKDGLIVHPPGPMPGPTHALSESLLRTLVATDPNRANPGASFCGDPSHANRGESLCGDPNHANRGSRGLTEKELHSLPLLDHVDDIDSAAGAPSNLANPGAPAA